ncbi:MAG TPA: CBS domain-containing protein [Halomicronema sp.]
MNYFKDNSNLIEQAIDRHPLIIDPQTPVIEAVKAMTKAQNSYSLIMENKQLLGILTERDIVKIRANSMNLEGVAVSKVMTQKLITIPLTETDNIFHLLTVLRTSKIRHLPILDDQENLVGVFTSESVRQILKPADLLQMRRVEEIITKNVLTAPTNSSIFEVAQQMATSKKSCVVICPSDNYFHAKNHNKPLKPIGIITERDIVKFTANNIDLEETTADKVMSYPLLPIENNANLWQAHQIMQEKRIRRLVVINKSGYLAGIITQSTLLHALDPVEMYATVELLQQTLAEQTHELTKAHQQMQSEVEHRKEIEEKLRQTNENLEEQVRQRTTELTHSNAQLLQQIQERITAETEIRRLNELLENRIQERTAQLAESNQQLQQKNQELATTLEKLKTTQQELIHSEKMAALGQLIAGIAHEINSPLGAIRSSIFNISNFLEKTFTILPQFFQNLSGNRQQDFFKILQLSNPQIDTLSSREKRQLRKALQQQIETLKIEESESLACTLIDLGITEINEFSNLLTSPHSNQILTTAYEFVTLQKSTNTIITATDRAAKIVFALKNYARYDHSGEKVFANITEGIETILTLYHNQLKLGIEIIRNYQPNLPSLWCYPDELNQVWTNLIHNAIQAMENTGTITIDINHQPENLTISISDTGPGIPPEILPHIFEPFFTTKPAGLGSGLGLDIVNKIIQKHTGKITVATQPGRTTFTITLPL